MPPSLGSNPVHDRMAEKADPVVDLVRKRRKKSGQKAGAQNVEEAEHYTGQNQQHFRSSFSPNPQDTKTALSQTIQNFKKVVTKQWDSMGAADTDVVLRTIKDPTALYLRQHLMAGGIEVVDPPEELPSGEEFL